MKTKFEEILKCDPDTVTVKTKVCHGKKLRWIEFIEPIDAESMFIGKAYEDGVVQGNTCYGIITV